MIRSDSYICLTVEPCDFILNIFQDILFTYIKQKRQCLKLSTFKTCFESNKAQMQILNSCRRFFTAEISTLLYIVVVKKFYENS